MSTRIQLHMGHYKTSVTGTGFSSSAAINLTTATVLDRSFTVPLAPNTLYFGKHLLIMGTAVAQWLKVLCYKSEGRWFDPSSCPCNFSLT